MFQTVELNQQQQSPPATSLPIQSSNVEIIQDGKIVKKVQKQDKERFYPVSIVIPRRSNVTDKNLALNVIN